MERGVAAAVLAFLAAANTPYVAEVEQWRAKREERLKADGGWLTVTGLFWLKDGANTFGSAPGNTIVLPASAPPARGCSTLRAVRPPCAWSPGCESSPATSR